MILVYRGTPKRAAGRKRAQQPAKKKPTSTSTPQLTTTTTATTKTQSAVKALKSESTATIASKPVASQGRLNGAAKTQVARKTVAGKKKPVAKPVGAKKVASQAPTCTCGAVSRSRANSVAKSGPNSISSTSTLVPDPPQLQNEARESKVRLSQATLSRGVSTTSIKRQPSVQKTEAISTGSQFRDVLSEKLSAILTSIDGEAFSGKMEDLGLYSYLCFNDIFFDYHQKFRLHKNLHLAFAGDGAFATHLILEKLQWLNSQ
jgi:hypothetical protein